MKTTAVGILSSNLSTFSASTSISTTSSYLYVSSVRRTRFSICHHRERRVTEPPNGQARPSRQFGLDHPDNSVSIVQTIRSRTVRTTAPRFSQSCEHLRRRTHRRTVSLLDLRRDEEARDAEQLELGERDLLSTQVHVDVGGGQV